MARQPYSDVRILDLCWWLGSYAGRLFADLGAEVIRVEPPGGLPDRRPGWDAGFAFLNASKKSVLAYTATAEGRRTFERLLATSRAVLLERDAPLWAEAEALRRARPDLVVTCISPFGRTGPLADAPASDLTLQAAGGMAWMSGRPEAPPLRLPFGQARMMASVYAATATALALRDAEATGRGRLVDVSAQECIAHSLQNAIQVWDLERRVSIRGGEGTRDATEDVFPCADGFVFLAAPPSLAASWAGLVGWMLEERHPSGSALSEPRWQDREWRLTAEARAAFRTAFCAFIPHRTRDALRAAAIERRIVMAPVARVHDLAEDRQLRDRGFFAPLAAGPAGASIPFPGAPYAMSPPLWQVAPAPAPGADGTGAA